MLGMFRRKEKPLTGAEMAEEGLRLVSLAAAKGEIQFQQGRVHADIFAHLDSPGGVSRLTYVMVSPTVQNQVIARCVIAMNRAERDVPIWQMDWAVLEAYRRQSFGLTIAVKSLLEFTNGMQGRFKNGYAIEAVVDEGNEASLKIARAVLADEKVIPNPHTGINVHSFLRFFPT